MKYFVIATSLILALCLFCGFMPSDEDMAVYDSTVRLHVLANSDDTHDQSVKLLVRDAVLDEIRALTEDAQSAEEASVMLTEGLSHIREICEQTLADMGEEIPVSVYFSEEKYPTRSYGTVRLPAGRYRSLRIELGEAAGRNWWCVLYPALCTDVAKTEASFIRTGFTSDQVHVLTGGDSPKYKIRFRILEFFGENFS
ncbi:MAG: stage II sporulation protein R [Clostridia bacterium]|nr:stage II sporulation protein R [Clostridia bacterium]